MLLIRHLTGHVVTSFESGIMSTLRQTAAGVGCVLCSGDRISSLHTVTPFCPALQVQLCSLRLRWHVSITSLIQLCIL